MRRSGIGSETIANSNRRVAFDARHVLAKGWGQVPPKSMSTQVLFRICQIADHFNRHMAEYIHYVLRPARYLNRLLGRMVGGRWIAAVAI